MFGQEAANIEGGQKHPINCGHLATKDKPFPAIYLYELPIEFNVRLWQLKHRDEDCALRSYTHTNSTDWKQHAFGMEVCNSCHIGRIGNPCRILIESFLASAVGGFV